MIVAVIRAGRKQAHSRKNIKPFAGKPMLHYSIKAARDSGLFDRIICSTDDKEIARVAEQEGAEAPFQRPSELADDITPTAPVLLHAIDWLEQRGDVVQHLCCIYPTVPFIRVSDIKLGYDLLKEKQAISTCCVTTYAYPILRSLSVNEQSRLEMIWPEYEPTRSQDLPEAYHDAGLFYWMDGPRFKEEKRLLSSDAVPVQLPRYLVQDIDTPEDWEMAERMYHALGRK